MSREDRAGVVDDEVEIVSARTHEGHVQLFDDEMETNGRATRRVIIVIVRRQVLTFHRNLSRTSNAARLVSDARLFRERVSGSIFDHSFTAAI